MKLPKIKHKKLQILSPRKTLGTGDTDAPLGWLLVTWTAPSATLYWKYPEYLFFQQCVMVANAWEASY
jgi:hypothetical protein